MTAGSPKRLTKAQRQARMKRLAKAPQVQQFLKDFATLFQAQGLKQ